MRLHLVTLNTWGLPAPLAPDRKGRLAATADWLDDVDADLVALQEVWAGAAPLYRRPVARSSDPGDDGLALDARGPLDQVASLRFARARGFDALKRKGALRAWSVEAGVWIVSTHLQAGRGAANAAVRRAQLDELVAWLAPLDGPVLLLGDLNLEHEDPTDLASTAWLAREGFADLALAAGADAPTYPGNGARYDRVLARDGRDHAVVAEHAEVIAWGGPGAPGRLSDHHAVSVRVRLEPTSDGVVAR